MLAGDGVRTTVGDTATEVRGLAALDAVRALAAIGVVLTHVAAVLLFRGMPMRWASIGDAGVLVFFVLSGYLIASSVLRPTRFDVRGYMIRRALRILPLYYASMLVALVLIDPTPLLSGPGRADVATHVVLLHGLSRGMRYSIAGIWWTLTVEWLFYVFMAIVAAVFRRPPYGWLIAIGMILLGVVWRLVVFETSTSAADSAYLVQQFPGAADLFGIGMLIGTRDAHRRRAATCGGMRRSVAPCCCCRRGSSPARCTCTTTGSRATGRTVRWWCCGPSCWPWRSRGCWSVSRVRPAPCMQPRDGPASGTSA